MITIQHQGKQVEIQISLSTIWLGQIGRMISRMLDFSDIRAMQKQKEKLLHEMGADLRKMN